MGSLCIWRFIHACMHACMHARMHECTQARKHACTHARMHACHIATQLEGASLGPKRFSLTTAPFSLRNCSRNKLPLLHTARRVTWEATSNEYSHMSRLPSSSRNSSDFITPDSWKCWMYPTKVPFFQLKRDRRTPVW